MRVNNQTININVSSMYIGHKRFKYARSTRLTVSLQVNSDLTDQNLKKNDQEGNARVDQGQAAPVAVVAVDLDTDRAAVEGNDTFKEEDEDNDLGGDLDVLHVGREVPVHDGVADIADLVVVSLDGGDQPDAETEADDPGGDGQVGDELGVAGEGAAADQHGTFGRDSEQLVDDTTNDSDPQAWNFETLG